MKKLFVSSLFLFLLLPGTVLLGDVSYSAMVMDITGNVEVQHEEEKKPLDLGDVLYPGDVVETAKGASLTVNYLRSGREERWPGGMKFTAGKTQSKRVPFQVIRKERKIVLPSIESPQKGSFTMKGSFTLRGEKPRIEVKGLSNTWILENRPIFRWHPIDGAETYRVTLYVVTKIDALWRKTTKETEMPYPESEPPLDLGSSYRWNLEALKGGKVIVSRRFYFHLAAKNDIARINKQKKKFEGQLARRPDNVSARLAFIFFLEDHRLYDDAIEQYEIICRKHEKSKAINKRKKHLLEIRLSRRRY